MAKNTDKKPATPAQEPETTTTPARVPDINEVDGEPIFHAPDEEGDCDNE